MCLAIPGEVLSIQGDDPAFLSGKVDFGGVRKEINFACTPDVRIGDYVLVHVGFALQVIDKQEAERNRRTLEEILQETHSEGQT
jgi:hydrogenase expression/formation protein HypC